jgi:hypothetical protein
LPCISGLLLGEFLDARFDAGGEGDVRRRVVGGVGGRGGTGAVAGG